MLSHIPQSARKRIAPGALFVGLMLIFSMLVSACGGTPTPGGNSSAPNDLLHAGTLTVGSDTTYPPQEFADPAAPDKFTGFDLDLITEMANRLGLKVDVKKANFDTILDDLSAKRYDVVISALTINDDRKKKADFIPYFTAGESLLVQKGNPEKLQSINDLCGKTVGVQTGTVEADDLTTASKKCKDSGKAEITQTVLKDQTDVIQLLANKRVVATYQDSPVTDYYLKQNPGQFEVAGSIVNTAAEGIAVRKGDTSMFNALKTAFDTVKADGTYDKLFTKWALNPAQKVTLADRRQAFA